MGTEIESSGFVRQWLITMRLVGEVNDPLLAALSSFEATFWRRMLPIVLYGKILPFKIPHHHHFLNSLVFVSQYSFHKNFFFFDGTRVCLYSLQIVLLVVGKRIDKRQIKEDS
jgi:hypothetical protein